MTGKKICSVVNCRKLIDNDQAMIINNKIYCRECAVLLNKMLIVNLARRNIQ